MSRPDFVKLELILHESGTICVLKSGNPIAEYDCPADMSELSEYITQELLNLRRGKSYPDV